MQMGILRLREVGIQLRQAHISNGAPLSCASFNITVMLAIESMFLNAVIEIQSIFQCLTVSRSPCILRESIDSKTNCIELFLGIQRLPFVIHTPIDATILRVYEMLYQIILGTSSRIQILLVTQNTICCRERPEDTGIKNCSFFCLWMQHATAVNTSIKATMLVVLHLIKPETQNVVLQHILHFLFHCLNLVHFLMG